jgi:hypothetical protein
VKPRPRTLTAVAAVLVLSAGGVVATRLLAPGQAPAPPPARPRRTAPAPRGTVPARPAGRCADIPHTCGFPDASNTGVPRGMVLRAVPGQAAGGRGWHFDRRQQVVQVTGRGAVLRGLSIPFTVNVKASGVTIADDRITASGENSFGVSLRHTAGVTIADSTITGRDQGGGRLLAGIKDIYGDSTGTRVIRDNIAFASTGVQLDTGLITGSYIHDPGYRRGDHVNGVTSNGGTALLVIRHNTIYTDRAQTDAIGLFEDFGPQANRIISGNLLAGGSYALYCGQNRGGPPARHIVVTGNLISRRFFARGGYWGPATGLGRRSRGNVWQGNTWAGTGRPVPRPGSRQPR